MGLWFNGWTGDNAGPVLGRQPNTLIVSMTISGGSYPTGLWDPPGDLDGKTWYYHIEVDCLTPGARAAIVTGFEEIGYHTYAVEVSEMDWGEEKDPWQAGVHLFSFGMAAYYSEQSGPATASTIASAVIDPTVRRMQGNAVAAFKLRDQMIRRSAHRQR